MESSGLTLSEAFEDLQPDTRGKISIAGFTRFLKKWYHFLSEKEVYKILTSLDIDGDSMIDYSEVQDFLISYSDMSSPNLKQTLQSIAQKIQNTGLSTHEYLEQQNLSGNISEQQLEQTLGSSMKLSVSQSSMVFHSLDLSGTGTVNAADLESAIQNYRTDEQVVRTMQTDLPPQNDNENTIKTFLEILEKSHFQPNKLFQLADVERTGVITLTQFKQAVLKIIPDIDRQLLDRVLRLFPSNAVHQNDITQVFQNKQTMQVPVPSPRRQTPSPVPSSSKVVLETRARPLPISSITHGKMATLFEKLIPYEIPVHEYFAQVEIYPKSLFNLDRFKKLCEQSSIAGTDAHDMFRALDTHTRGDVYAYSIFTVADSYKRDLSRLPFAQNENSDENCRQILNEVVKKFSKAKPLYRQIPRDLEKQIVNWEQELDFLNLPPRSYTVIGNAFPRPCYFYHVAAVLQSYQQSVFLCAEQLMHCAIDLNEISTQAPEYFQQFGISISDLCEKGEFIEKITSSLGLKASEAEEIHRTVYGKLEGARPMYDFFTFFDMIISMYHNGIISHPLPYLPVSYKENLDPNTRSFYIRLAGNMNQPLSKYGLFLHKNYTPQEICAILEQSTPLRQQETVPYISRLIFNSNNRIRLYHFLTVVDSYRGKPMSLAFIPTEALELIQDRIPRGTAGAQWLKDTARKDLNAQLVQSDMEHIFPWVTQSDRDALFMFLDYNQRKFIYGHTIATIVDVATELRGDLRVFPLNQNVRCNRDVRQILQKMAQSLDVVKKSAIDFYIEQGISLEERLDREGFSSRFGFELRPNEALHIFNALQLNSTTVRVYHYVTCMESFCKALTTPPQSTIESHLENFAVKIPQSVKTKDFLQIPKLTSYYNEQQFSQLLQPLNLTGPQVAQLFRLIDEQSHSRIFAYQIITHLDSWRTAVENGAVVRKHLVLPFASKQNIFKQPSAILKNIAERLDLSREATAEFYWKRGADLQGLISNIEFADILEDYNPQQVNTLFGVLDLEETGMIQFCHFLGVLESYRKRWVEAGEAPPKAVKAQNVVDAGDDELFEDIQVPKQPSPVPQSLPDTDLLEDALTKLAKYLQGANERGRPLGGREVFGLLDQNKDGKIQVDEFEMSINRLSLSITQNQLKELVKIADKDGNGIIDYEEFSNFVLRFANRNVGRKSPQPEKAPKTRPISEMKGLDRNLASFEPGSFDEAVYKLKLYVRNNYNTFTSMEQTFQRLDEDETGTLNELEFELALNRTKLQFSKKQMAELLFMADSNKDGQLEYTEFINFIFDYDFSAIPQDLERAQSTYSPAPERRRTFRDGSLTPDQTFATFREGDPVFEIKNYEIKPEDYWSDIFPSYTTILNNEFAAIKRCLELIQQISPGQRFKDPDFGPEKRNNGAHCLYWQGEPPNSNFPPPSELQWKSPTEWLENVQFFSNDISANDVIQGSLGDCWFISALSVLAMRDEYVRGSIESLNDAGLITRETCMKLSQGVYPPIFHCFAQKGIYVLKFQKNSAWRWVIVDDRVPTFDVGGQYEYVFGHCKEENEIWVALIEKAYAKLHGCYEALNGGLIDDGLVDLTGKVAEKTKLTGKGGVLEVPQEKYVKACDALWKKLVDYYNEGSLMGCSVDGQGIETDVVLDGERTGILAGHAYSLSQVTLIENPDAHNPKKRHRLLRLRNPWGQREWTGKWSDQSDETRQFYQLLKRHFTEAVEAEDAWNPDDHNDGDFLMCFADWRKIFNNLFACVDFLDHWSGIRFSDEWTAETSGGVPNTAKRADAERWARNPQYIIELKTGAELFISLQQQDGRCIKGFQFPYEGYVRTSCFAIMRLGPKEEKVALFDHTKVITLSVLKLHREVHKRINLEAGRYAIVPATMNPGETGKFWLNIYFNVHKGLVATYKSGDKTNTGEPIAEEEEQEYVATEGDVHSFRELFEYLRSHV